LKQSEIRYSTFMRTFAKNICNNMKRNLILFLLAMTSLTLCARTLKKEVNKTSMTNPMIWADVPDPDVIRVGDTFYMVSTTMHLMPGAPIMKSKDLVHWQIINYVFNNIKDNSKYDLINGTVYGRGQWATSIRYNKGRFYILFSPNDNPYRAFIYTATNPEGKWTLLTRTKHFHDNSLFFDDDNRVYVFSGTGYLTELKSDLTDVKPDGINTKVFDRDSTETGLLEGNRVIKHDGKYYLLMISWPNGKPRRQVCYRADKITGPYEKKVILQDNFAGFPYCGQGTIVDGPDGNWYGIIFQDRGAVGRVPLLMPVRWIDGWPMLGDDNGKVPQTWSTPFKSSDSGKPIIMSDDFKSGKLNLDWQWNHNPVDKAWSLTERLGYMRLKTSRIVSNLYAAPNTLSQRMEGPTCSGIISMDISKMKDGDVAGFAAFNGHTAMLQIKKEGNSSTLSMTTNVVNLNDNKNITSVDVDDEAKVSLNTNIIYLKIACDFHSGKDMATFFYSTDGKTWTPIGNPYKMRFDFRRLFMGSRFAIFNYATKSEGGYVDVDYFKYYKD
jgi:beta-xylosidase